MKICCACDACPIFWKWAHKNIPARQKLVAFRKSQKRTKSLHPNIHRCSAEQKNGLFQNIDVHSSNALCALRQFYRTELNLKIWLPPDKVWVKKVKVTGNSAKNSGQGLISVLLQKQMVEAKLSLIWKPCTNCKLFV